MFPMEAFKMFCFIWRIKTFSLHIIILYFIAPNSFFFFNSLTYSAVLFLVVE